MKSVWDRAYLQAAMGERNRQFLAELAAYVKEKNVPFSPYG